MRGLFLLLLLLFAPLLASLRFGSFQMAPFAMRKRECWLDDGKQECAMNNAFEGLCVELMKLLGRAMNVDYRIEIRRGPGSLQPDGTWDGLIADVNASIVDLAVAAIAITPERAAVVDFSPPFLSSGISLMVNKSFGKSLPSPQRAPSLHSFAPATWIAVVVLQIMSISTTVTLYCYMKQREDQQQLRQWRCCIWLFSLLVWIGCSLVLFLAILPLWGPASNANLNENRYVDSSVEGWLSRGDIKYGIRQDDTPYQFFKNSKNPLHAKMMETMEQNGDSSFHTSDYSRINGLDRMREANGTFALIVDDVINTYDNMRMPCETMKIGKNLATHQFAVVTKKGSDLSEKVRVAMESILRSGDLDRIYRQWFKERSQCTPEILGIDNEMSETNKSVACAIYGMIGGIALSIVVSLIVAHLERNRSNFPVKFTDEVTPMNA